MKKAVSELVIKAGKAIILMISTQIVNYLSSEEFSNKVKNFIQEMVNKIVKLVMSEKISDITK
ncbi:hypothetical protein [Carnobacterium inhibens]|uniref:Uncharacterized protein n=1 Tax=Carnobacterium inhibens subsp. gilichinskyi TaxID=1266845 RepID=U5SFJ9_9LACT|nr:hypothetical protein [Carnobacterium inhibens]AGY82888.1 hypothetical protein Q783_10745 [Carnobacterium inhibens subsp. gilichinskyi]